MLISGYITNLGKYNEGELVGQWIDFPISQDTLMEILEDIGIDGERYEEFFFTDWECEEFDVHPLFGEYPSIDTVNAVAELIEPYDSPVEYATYEAEVYDFPIPMDEFNECLAGYSAEDIAFKIHYGDFNPTYDYFNFDGYANLESYTEFDLRELAQTIMQDSLEDFIRGM